MSKYNVLWEYIQKDGSDFLELIFEQIKNITDIPIDHSFLNISK